MLARVPEQLNCIDPRMSPWRAVIAVMVPLSVLTIASSSSRLLSSCVPPCGFVIRLLPDQRPADRRLLSAGGGEQLRRRADRTAACENERLLRIVKDVG